MRTESSKSQMFPWLKLSSVIVTDENTVPERGNAKKRKKSTIIPLDGSVTTRYLKSRIEPYTKTNFKILFFVSQLLKWQMDTRERGTPTLHMWTIGRSQIRFSWVLSSAVQLNVKCSVVKKIGLARTTGDCPQYFSHFSLNYFFHMIWEALCPKQGSNAVCPSLQTLGNSLTVSETHTITQYTADKTVSFQKEWPCDPVLHTKTTLPL